MKHLVASLLIFSLTISTSVAQNANQLVAEMVETLGGKQTFYNLKNVTYDYAYTNPNGGKLRGKETYVFDGELSLGIYSEHSLLGSMGKIIEGYDGTNAWVKINGTASSDKKANGVARFLRKTNYYWFTMFFKLQDEGVNLEHLGNKKVEGHAYDLVKVTFGNTIGDAQDTYILYINKRTKLVDQFLFNVVANNSMDPRLMKVRYETIDGIKIATERSYIDANWDGDVIGEKWTTTYWSNIRFNTKIDSKMFLP